MTFSARQGFFSSFGAPSVNTRRTGAASSNAARTWTTGSTGAELDTTEKKFGDGSLDCPTSSGWLGAPANTPVNNFGTSNFTIEWWQYIPSLSGHSSDCSLLGSTWTGGFGMRLAEQFETNGLSSANPKWFNIYARAQADLDRWDITTRTGGGSWTASQWYFCALQRKGHAMSFWVDGLVCDRSGSGGGIRNFTPDPDSNLGNRIRLGAQAPTEGAGPILIDEICWSNSWRYENPFIDIPVPTAPFTVDEYTTQLLHLDADPFVNDTGS
jgi:hypothetical protein